MPSSKSRLAALFRHPGHLLWIAIAYIPFLGGMSVPLTGDQKVYLSTALEMRQSGSWLRPILFGEASYYKPPLEYWATLFGWNVFGFNLWGALLPSVFAVLGTAWFLCEITDLLDEKRHLRTAGLWFAAALATVTFGTTAQMEIYLCLFNAAAWWAGLKFLSRPPEERHSGWLYVAFGLAGVLAIVKSPLYSVLWVAGYLSYLVVSGEWDLFRRKHIWGAWLLGGLVGASWYLAVLAVDGQRFWSDYLIRETWAKNSGNGSTIGGFWLAMLYFCFPFTLLIIPALQVVWKKRRSGPMLNFLFAWSWAPALFFTFYPYRTRPYLYILVPVLAILVDQACFRVWHSKFLRATAWATGVLFALVLATVGFVLWRAELVSPLVSAGFVAIGALGAWAGVKGQMRGFVIAALGAVLLFRFSAVSIGETDLAGLRTAVKESPGVPVAMLDEKRNIWHELGLVSAALGKPVERLYDLDQAADALQQGRMVVLSDVQSAELLASLEAKLLGRSDLRSVEKREWWRWKGRLKFPFKELILHGRAGVPDFEEKTKRRFLILTLAKPLLNAGPIQGEIYEWEVDVDGRGRPGRSGRVEWLRKDGAEGAKRDRARPGSFS